MAFGIKSALLKCFPWRQLLADLLGVETDIYNILVWGTNKEEMTHG